MARRPLMQMAWDGVRPFAIGRDDAARMIRGNRRKAHQLRDRFVRFERGTTRIALRGCDAVAIIDRVPAAPVVEPAQIAWRCAVKAPDGTRQFVNVEGVTRAEAFIRAGEFGTVVACLPMAERREQVRA